MFSNLQLDHYPVGATVIALSIVAVIICQMVLNRILGKDRIKQCHEVGGYYLAIVGSFYAVLLGLIVFGAMDKFLDAEKTVEQEGKSILAVYSIASQFGSEGKYIQEKIRQYTDEVVNTEWELMEKDQISMKARKGFLEALAAIKKIDPSTENQKALYPTLISEAIKLWESRRDRTKKSNEGIPTAEWVILFIGAAITLIFTFFFTIENEGIHLVMTGMISLMIFLSLYLVLLFGEPFSGDMKVSNHGLVVARNIINEINNSME